MIFSPWRNRILLDYAQWICDYPLLRSMGAPFLGEGEKYFSVIDDPEIEVLKALWEQDAYLRIPLSQRLQGTGWVNREKYYRFASIIAAGAKAVQKSDKEILTIGNLKRGVWLLVAALSKEWKEIKVVRQYPHAVKYLILYCKRTPELRYVPEILTITQEEGYERTSSIERVI